MQKAREIEQPLKKRLAGHGCPYRADVENKGNGLIILILK